MYRDIPSSSTSTLKAVPGQTRAVSQVPCFLSPHDGVNNQRLSRRVQIQREARNLLDHARKPWVSILGELSPQGGMFLTMPEWEKNNALTGSQLVPTATQCLRNWAKRYRASRYCPQKATRKM